MIPLAVYDGDQWWNRWPSDHYSGERPELPTGLDTIPPAWLPPGTRMPSNWRVRAKNGRSHAIRALRPIRTFIAEEDQAIGLQSDFKWTPLDEQDSLIASAGAGTVGRFVEPTDTESRRVLSQLTPQLQASEKQAMSEWLKLYELSPTTQFRQVFRTPADRNNPTFALRRAEMPFKGNIYYHLSGEKLFVWKPEDDEHSCKVNLTFNGIVAVGRDGRPMLEHQTAFAYAEFCGDSAETVVPVGTWQSNDQLLWIATVYQEGGFDYVVIDAQTGEPLSLREFPFVRVPIEFHDEGCTIEDLCNALEQLRSVVRSRRPEILAPFVSASARARKWDHARNLALELDDPQSPAWTALDILLSAGGAVTTLDERTAFCAPSASRASPNDDFAFRSGVALKEGEAVWSVAVPAASIHEAPSDTSRRIAVASNELIAVIDPDKWTAPGDGDGWVTVRWDRRTGYTRRRNLRSPNEPWYCLSKDSGRWSVALFSVDVIR